jgi:hypothetical protein
MSDRIFHDALQTILREVFNGPPADEAYILNPGDPGLLRQLDTLDAAAASMRPMPGRTTIAAHVDHVYYGLSLLNRWVDGEENPWAGADWNASWQRGQVDEAPWQSLRDRLRDEAARWQAAVKRITDWNHLTACGALSSAAHTAYHLGAIRQILAALGDGRPAGA